MFEVRWKNGFIAQYNFRYIHFFGINIWKMSLAENYRNFP